MGGRSRWVWLWVGPLFVGACGGGLQGIWDGSGEVDEGRFFSFVLDLKESERPVADFGFTGGDRVRVAVCGLSEQEGRVEFKMDVDTRAQTCEALRSPYRFIGEYGRDVLTGRVLDWTGREVGMFRAYRAQ